MVKIKRVYDWLDETAPFSVIYKHDNVGLIIGDMEENTSAVIVALDLTDDVIREAVKLNAKLIITHHPPIYYPISTLPSRSAVYKAAAAGLTVIAAHTNLDMAAGGVNDQLCAKIGFTDTSVFSGGIGRLCTLDVPVSPHDLAEKIKAALNAPGITGVAVSDKCRKIAVVCGGGSDCFEEAADLGVDTFITGEAPHHVMISAYNRGVNLICAGHFYSENVVCQPLCRLLSERFPELNCQVSNWTLPDFFV